MRTTPRQTPRPERRRKASSGLEVGQPRERLLRGRVVVFFAVVRLRVDAFFGEALAAVTLARSFVALPFPFPFERERVRSTCCRCSSCRCAAALWARPL